jgi:hypothetical protein
VAHFLNAKDRLTPDLSNQESTGEQTVPRTLRYIGLVNKEECLVVEFQTM